MAQRGPEGTQRDPNRHKGVQNRRPTNELGEVFHRVRGPLCTHLRLLQMLFQAPLTLFGKNVDSKVLKGPWICIWGSSLSNVHFSPSNCQIEKPLLKFFKVEKPLLKFFKVFFFTNIGLSAFIWTQWTILIQKKIGPTSFFTRKGQYLVLQVRHGLLNHLVYQES